VTRLGDFSPFGQWFCLFGSLKITKVAKIWATFFYIKFMYCLRQKKAWVTFWAIFSQTQQVTLVSSYVLTQNRLGSSEATVTNDGRITITINQQLTNYSCMDVGSTFL
jgi:hypothetical protein